MKKLFLRIFGAIFILISTFFIGTVAYVTFSSSTLHMEGVIIISMIISCTGYIGVQLYSFTLDVSKKKLLMKSFLISILLTYTLMFIEMTLFKIPSWHPNGVRSVFSFNSSEFTNYLDYRFNVIPFKTIFTYISSYMDKSLSNRLIVSNLGGNIIGLMPLGILLPLIFEKLNRFRNYIFTIILIVMAIETIQFIFLLGSFDIDDFILNIFGATLTFLIFKINSIENLFRRFF